MNRANKVAAGFAILIGLAALIAWARSFRYSDGWSIQYEVISPKGQILTDWSVDLVSEQCALAVSFERFSYMLEVSAQPAPGLHTVRRSTPAGQSSVRLLGHGLHLRHFAVSSAQRAAGYPAGNELDVPDWLIVSAALAMLLIAIYRRKPSLAGHCPSCGYDLRASPGRCPECGVEQTTGKVHFP
jgi:hypothetical protein